MVQKALNRQEIKQLESWSRESTRKPLIIRGARQVGKSTLVREFARTSTFSLLEINFERNPEFREAFTSPDPNLILVTLKLMTGQNVEEGSTILFLDEIQIAPEALLALRYFYEEMPGLRVIAAGSLLEFTFANAKFSMPVGRIEYMHLGPMHFEDFLDAMGHPQLAALIRGFSLADIHTSAIPGPVHDKLLALLRQYWVVGGLPEAIARYAQSGDFSDVSRVQQSILATYRDDFNKYSHGSLKDRVQLVFDKLPVMVGRKFKYTQLSRDHRAAELASALNQLCMARVSHKVKHTAANGVPLGAEVNERCFKVLYLDVGMMCAALHLNILDLAKEDPTLVNSGAVAEQFIGQHLLYSGPSYETPALYYWVREAKSAAAEIDYLISEGQQIIPVEIKAGTTGSLKSLHQFLKEKRCDFGLRFNADVPSLFKGATTLTDKARINFELLSLPLYMVGQARRLLRDINECHWDQTRSKE
jgi:predicted AAA+ superfamily ATPase